MKYVHLTSHLAKFYLALIVVAAASMTLMNSAHARNVIQTGTIEAQHFCHDGANRGASIAISLSKYDRPSFGGRKFKWGTEPFRILYGTSPKSYYAGTSCFDMSSMEEGSNNIDEYAFDDVVLPGTILYAWYNIGIKLNLCQDFNIKYVKNGKQVWVQNGGSTRWNVTCVAKDSL